MPLYFPMQNTFFNCTKFNLTCCFTLLYFIILILYYSRISILNSHFISHQYFFIYYFSFCQEKKMEKLYVIPYFFSLTSKYNSSFKFLQCTFCSKLKSKLILLFSLSLLLFMSPTTLFDIIHRYHCTISSSFYLYLQYFFQQKVFSFNKISRS